MRDYNKKSTDLKKDTINSSFWGFLDKGMGFIVQFTIGIVLARLLPPSDFGLIGLAMIVIGFGEIFVKLGLGPAIIQKKYITERHIRVVLTTSVAAGVILSLVIFLTAPLFSWVLGNDDVVPIIEVLAILFIIIGFQIPSKAILVRSLDFKHIFYVQFIQSILYGTVTIYMAIAGFGVWSLVIGNIFGNIITLIGNYLYVRHRLKPLFSRKEFNELIYFGSGETASGIFSYFALSGDYFIIGKILGTEALGLYTKAYNLMMMPTTKFVSVITDILFPTASQLQNDNERLQRIFLKSMQMVAFILLPICSLFIMVAPELVIGLFGKNWTGAVIPLQILALFGVFRGMYNASASFLKAKGWVYQIFWAQVVYGILVIGLVWPSSIYYGLTGASWAVGFAIFSMWCILMELNHHAIGVNRSETVKTLVPGLLMSCIVIGSISLGKVLITNIEIPILRLILLTATCLIAGISSILLIPQRWLFYLPKEILDGIPENKIKNSFLIKYFEKRITK